MDEEVYKQLCEDHRFFGDTRFKQLTLWTGATALLINSRFLSDKGSFSALGAHPLVVPVIGMLITAIFWIMEIKSTLHGVIALSKKNAYEAAHGAANNPNTPKVHLNLVNHTNITLLLYVGTYLTWWWILRLQREGLVQWVSIFIFGILALFLLLYTLAQYFQLWRHASKDPKIEES